MKPTPPLTEPQPDAVSQSALLPEPVDGPASGPHPPPLAELTGLSEPAAADMMMAEVKIEVQEAPVPMATC